MKKLITIYIWGHSERVLFLKYTFRYVDKLPLKTRVEKHWSVHIMFSFLFLYFAYYFFTIIANYSTVLPSITFSISRRHQSVVSYALTLMSATNKKIFQRQKWNKMFCSHWRPHCKDSQCTVINKFRHLYAILLLQYNQF